MNIDKYFEAARQVPTSISVEEVETIVATGTALVAGTMMVKSALLTKKIMIMLSSVTLALATAGTIYLVTPSDTPPPKQPLAQVQPVAIEQEQIQPDTLVPDPPVPPVLEAPVAEPAPVAPVAPEPAAAPEPSTQPTAPTAPEPVTPPQLSDREPLMTTNDEPLLAFVEDKTIEVYRPHTAYRFGVGEPNKVVITKETSSQELDELITKLAKEDIDMKIHNSNHNDGELTAITGKVVFPESCKLSFSCEDFEKVVISWNKEENYSDCNVNCVGCKSSHVDCHSKGD